MIASLARQPAWIETMTADMREKLVQKLRDGLDTAESSREIASIAKALAGLERNDIERTKLLIDAEAKDGDGLDDARRLRADLDEIDRLEGTRAD